MSEDVLGPVTLLVTDRIDKAFDAIYPAEGGGYDSHSYGILFLEDRHGKRYLWAQAPPHFDPAKDAKPKLHFSGLRPGTFITTTYRLRDRFLGAEQQWHVPEPDGTHISHVNHRSARKEHRWPTSIKVEKPDRSELNALIDELAEEYRRGN